MSKKNNDRPTLADMVFQKVCPDNKFLDEMNEVIPWGEIEIFFNKHLKRKDTKAGRPAYPTMLMFKIHLLQQWNDLSDEGVEYLIYDRLSFRKFLGLGIESNIPDSTTIENFRHLMEEKNWGEKILKMIDDYLVSKGLIRKEGNIVDSTFLRANSKPKSKEKAEEKTDIDAEFGHKGFGYNASINMDKESKFIRKTYTVSADVLDHQSMEGTLIGDEKELYGDRGYEPARKILKNNKKYKGCKVRIMFKRKRGKKDQPAPQLSERKKALNKAYSRIRARVEHVFGIMKEAFGFKRLRYRGLERVSNKFNSLSIAYNFRRLGFILKRKPNEIQPNCA